MLIKIGERMKRIREREQGFTLVELLVVIVILGVIAALLIPKLGGNVDVAKQKADLAQLEQLNSAIERYKLLNNGATPNVSSYRATITDLKNAKLIDEDFKWQAGKTPTWNSGKSQYELNFNSN
ncbi:type II secretion system protein [Carboxydocella sp. JDF658]|uniref:type II secretion system protein n=1 Tax=Carboxydocella sp. JDF658 TaxID=1926600 RepID=UPI0009ACEAAB|nr:prepilin-type N-terminal cleavage/methylation domain-containing protein [Carboxydocella sp. JDF658]GAW31025.1 prepilin-type N-terminal cleavage/methylation domain-containing protein [Carboxydocella sp. JDF658]